MPKFPVAHLKEQGQDLVVIFVSSAMRYKTLQERQATLEDFQASSLAAGLAGTAALAWEFGSRLEYFCAPAFQTFFSSLSYEDLTANINRTLTAKLP